MHVSFSPLCHATKHGAVHGDAGALYSAENAPSGAESVAGVCVVTGDDAKARDRLLQGLVAAGGRPVEVSRWAAGGPLSERGGTPSACAAFAWLPQTVVNRCGEAMRLLAIDTKGLATAAGASLLPRLLALSSTVVYVPSPGETFESNSLSRSLCGPGLAFDATSPYTSTGRKPLLCWVSASGDKHAEHEPVPPALQGAFRGMLVEAAAGFPSQNFWRRLRPNEAIKPPAHVELGDKPLNPLRPAAAAEEPQRRRPNASASPPPATVAGCPPARVSIAAGSDSEGDAGGAAAAKPRSRSPQQPALSDSAYRDAKRQAKAASHRQCTNALRALCEGPDRKLKEATGAAARDAHHRKGYASWTDWETDVHLLLEAYAEEARGVSKAHVLGELFTRWVMPNCRVVHEAVLAKARAEGESALAARCADWDAQSTELMAAFEPSSAALARCEAELTGERLAAAALRRELEAERARYRAGVRDVTLQLEHAERAARRHKDAARSLRLRLVEISAEGDRHAGDPGAWASVRAGISSILNDAPAPSSPSPLRLNQKHDVSWKTALSTGDELAANGGSRSLESAGFSLKAAADELVATRVQAERSAWAAAQSEEAAAGLSAELQAKTAAAGEAAAALRDAHARVTREAYAASKLREELVRTRKDAAEAEHHRQAAAARLEYAETALAAARPAPAAFVQLEQDALRSRIEADASGEFTQAVAAHAASVRRAGAVEAERARAKAGAAHEKLAGDLAAARARIADLSGAAEAAGRGQADSWAEAAALRAEVSALEAAVRRERAVHGDVVERVEAAAGENDAVLRGLRGEAAVLASELTKAGESLSDKTARLAAEAAANRALRASVTALSSEKDRLVLAADDAAGRAGDAEGRAAALERQLADAAADVAHARGRAAAGEARWEAAELRGSAERDAAKEAEDRLRDELAAAKAAADAAAAAAHDADLRRVRAEARAEAAEAAAERLRLELAAATELTTRLQSDLTSQRHLADEARLDAETERIRVDEAAGQHEREAARREEAHARELREKEASFAARVEELEGELERAEAKRSDLAAEAAELRTRCEKEHASTVRGAREAAEARALLLVARQDQAAAAEAHRADLDLFKEAAEEDARRQAHDAAALRARLDSARGAAAKHEAEAAALRREVAAAKPVRDRLALRERELLDTSQQLAGATAQLEALSSTVSGLEDVNRVTSTEGELLRKVFEQQTAALTDQLNAAMNANAELRESLREKEASYQEDLHTARNELAAAEIRAERDRASAEAEQGRWEAEREKLAHDAGRQKSEGHRALVEKTRVVKELAELRVVASAAKASAEAEIAENGALKDRVAALEAALRDAQSDARAAKAEARSLEAQATSDKKRQRSQKLHDAVAATGSSTTSAPRAAPHGHSPLALPQQQQQQQLLRGASTSPPTSLPDRSPILPPSLTPSVRRPPRKLSLPRDYPDA
ncbi:hypothetical protein DIPPA_12574 [Diplonema papillatum]|nr:hypothetical protein DIPPA_12574 [Diplonema papillatum]